MVWSFYSVCTAAFTPLLYVCSLEVRVLHCLDKDTLSVSCVRELLFPASLSSSRLNQIGWDERCGAQKHWHSLKNWFLKQSYTD